MGSMSISSCRCCMFVSCMHPVAVLNAAFCMTCSMLMLFDDASAFMICRGMCVLYVSFGSYVRARNLYFMSIEQNENI